MANRRLVVSGTGLRPVQRQPAVRVRDNFLPGAAARGASSDLEQLARGFGSLSPALSNLARSLQEKKRLEGQAEGRTRLVELAQEQEDFGKAVQQGLLEFKDNPFARAGLLEQAGRIAGDRYGDDLRIAVQQLPDKTDMAAFDRTASETFGAAQKSLGDVAASTFFRNAFSASTQAHTSGQRRSFASQQSAELIGVAADQLYAETFGKIETALAEGIGAEDIGRILTAVGDEAVLNGVNGTLVNRTLIEAVTQAGIELATRAPDMAMDVLDILDFVQGKSGPLSRTRVGSKAINAALDSISGTVQRGYRFQEWQELKALKETTTETYGAAVSEMLEASDPTAVDLAPYIAKMVDAGNSQAANALLGIQNAIGGGEFNTVESVYIGLATRIWTMGDVTPTEVMNAVGARQLSMPDGQNLLTQIESKNRNARAGQSSTDPIFTNTLSDVGRAFQDSLGILGGARGEQANRAEASIQWDYYRAKERGVFDDMSDSDRAAWLRDRASHWIEYYGGGKPIGEEIEGLSVQAFVGRSGVWENTVVVSVDQLTALTLRLAQKEMTPADRNLLRSLGVPPAAVGAFISAQQELIRQAVFLPNEPAEEAVVNPEENQ